MFERDQGVEGASVVRINVKDETVYKKRIKLNVVVFLSYNTWFFLFITKALERGKKKKRRWAKS